MTQQFYTVLTNIGAAALSNALALGRDVVVTNFAVGDGGGPGFDPTVEDMKAAEDLVNRVYAGAINELKVDEENPARYFIEGIVPVDVGGWTVREAGWYLENGDLFAITKYPPSYKSVLSDGAATELPIRTYVATGAVDNIQLKIDPTVVLATQDFAKRVVESHNSSDNCHADIREQLARCATKDELTNSNKPNFIKTQDDDIALNKLNVFNVIKPIQLPEASEDCICRVLVLAAVTEENKQPFTAPNGKKITVLSTGEQHETTNIVTRNVEYTFKSIDGEWYV